MHLLYVARGAGALAALGALAAAPLCGQVSLVRGPASWVGAPIEEYSRLLQLTGVMPLSSRMIRPMAAPEGWTPADSAAWRAPWVARFSGVRRGSDADTSRVEVLLIDPESPPSSNSDFPTGTKGGSVWAGPGLSAGLSPGGAARAGVVTVQLAPTYTW